MFPTFLALVGFFSVLGISEQLVNPRPVATAAADSLESVSILPGDFVYTHGDQYDTARFERAISDSGRAADSARGDLCPRVCPSAAVKPSQPIQLATRATVAPTSCSPYACRLED